MIKIISIKILDSYKILCVFNTNEAKILDLSNVLDLKNKLAKKIFSTEIFQQAKLGEFGQIVWKGIGEIVELDGSVSPCDYDISPEFAYHNSYKLDLV
jgi:hypothetical protein